MNDLKVRWQAQSYGLVRENRAIRDAMALVHLARARFAPAGSERKLLSLAAAARLATRAPLRSVVARALRPWLTGDAADTWRTTGAGLGRYDASFGDMSSRALTTSIVLKAPGPNGEKGVLYSSFEYNWMRLVHHGRARDFFRDWYLVGASSWSPGDYIAFGHLAGLSTDPVFIGVSHVSDMETYRVAAPAIAPVPLMACDWVDPDFYEPRPKSERTIDILMVANWLRFKRHWLLFEALRDMPRSLRVVLVGRNGPGRTEREIRAEARAYGVRQELELHTDIGPRDVARLQAEARISIICSQREGSCVAPVEAMFADTPVAMFRDAHVGSTAHVNAHTGRLVTRAGLARQLTELLEASASLHPRTWAMQHISCHQSSARLNEILREHALRGGQPWTTDIAPLAWRYVPCHVHAADEVRLRPTVGLLAEQYGVELAAPRAV